jgi:hypothetical protein
VSDVVFYGDVKAGVGHIFSYVVSALRDKFRCYHCSVSGLTARVKIVSNMYSFNQP